MKRIAYSFVRGKSSQLVRPGREGGSRGRPGNARPARDVPGHMDRPVGILYEHPLWFGPLFAELERRGVPYERIDAAALSFDPADLEQRYSVVVNRMSPSAWTRGHERAIFATLHY